MKELLEFIVKSLVDDESKVVVDESENDREVVYTIKTAPDDFGKIIGRSGKVATAIRTVVRTAAKKSNRHVFVKFEK